jgi:translation initiation factor RLI1
MRSKKYQFNANVKERKKRKKKEGKQGKNLQRDYQSFTLKSMKGKINVRERLTI